MAAKAAGTASRPAMPKSRKAKKPMDRVTEAASNMSMEAARP
jgi:hypothetical protein